MDIRGFIVNRKEYKKENLIGKWVEFPIGEEELEEELEEIGVESECFDECFFKYWESEDFDASVILSENEDIEFLNTLANMDFDDILPMYYETFPNNTIYDMTDLEKMLKGCSGIDAIHKVWYGKFNPNHNYFTFDGYANLKSMNEAGKKELEEMYFAEQIYNIRIWQ